MVVPRCGAGDAAATPPRSSSSEVAFFSAAQGLDGAALQASALPTGTRGFSSALGHERDAVTHIWPQQ